MGLPSEFSTAHAGRWQAAMELCRAAGKVTLEYFQSSRFEVIRKSDQSPVTIADQKAEQFLRAEVLKRFPQDSFLGEEFGETVGTSEYRWIVDPIDGTKSFIFGVPLYSTLIGVCVGQKSIIGAIAIPALDEIIHASVGSGAYYHQGDRAPVRASVAKNVGLADGLFVSSQVDSFDARGAADGYREIQKKAFVTRTWGDGFGYLLVATGRAAVMVDPKANPWDVAACQPVVEEAGGRFSDWAGKPTIFSGDAVGSNGTVHDEVIKSLAR